MSDVPTLGIDATVVCDPNTHGPRRLSYERVGLRTVLVRDVERLYGDEADFNPTHEPLVDDFSIVSAYSLHVALYALQNPTPENIRRALYRLGTSGDCEEHTDNETLLPLPVSEPPGWHDWMPTEENE